MHLFSFIKEVGIYLGIGETDSRNIQEAVILSNVQRIVYICGVGIIVILLNILLYAFAEESVSPVQQQWLKWNYVVQVAGMTILFVIGGFLFWYRNTHTVVSLFVANISVIIILVFSLVLGILITCIDQLITPAITPFIITCTVLSVVLYLRPIVSITVFLFCYLLFYVAIPFGQPDPDILLSNRADGLYAVGVGICLSIVMWRAALMRHKQNEIIEIQKNDLEKNYHQLQITSVELEKANATKDSFFAIIAHDIRTPISNLNGFLNIMNMEASGLSEEKKKYYISLMADTSRATLKLLEDLLTWARAQKGEIAYHPDSHILYELCEANVRLYKQGAEYKKITLTNAIPRDLVAVFDYAMIDTVIRNLIANALKYTRENGEVILSAIMHEHALEVSVRDTGIGMSKEVLGSLFAIDSKQASILGTQGEKGTGLGLILCHEFLSFHKGSIRAESQQDSGSRFIFTIPQ